MKKIVKFTLIVFILSVCLVVFKSHCLGQIPKEDVYESKIFGKVKSIEEKYFFVNKDSTGSFVQNSQPISMINYYYDLAGTLIEKRDSMVEEKTVLKTKYLYKTDNKGRVIECQEQKSDGDPFDKVFKYNGKGDRSEITTYSFNSDGTVNTLNVFTLEKYTYDEKNHKIEKKEFSLNKLFIKYKYDLTGRETEQIYYSPMDGKWFQKLLSRYTDFNKDGNWIRKAIDIQEVNIPKKPFLIVERLLEYYE